MPEITLPQGTIHYRDEGAGPPLVFVHGALVNGRLWEPVVERLAGDVRCIVPELPLGSHTRPMTADADLSPTGLARLIADFIAALDLEDVTLVGNDTGGALCQLVVGRHPERLARLALTNCDAFENFPPKAFRGLVIGARTRTLNAAMQPMRVRSVRRLPLAYGWLTKRPLPDDVLDGWVEPYLSDPGIRRDTAALPCRRRPGLPARQRGPADGVRPAGADRVGARGPVLPDRGRPPPGRRLPRRAGRGDRRRADVRQLGPARPPGRAAARVRAPAGCGAASRRALCGIGRPGPDP